MHLRKVDFSYLSPRSEDIERPLLNMDTDEHLYRSPFQRDRDRIIHSRAFRRMYNKTQIFLAGDNDYARTRLTHTLEVDQIARTIAKFLNLDVDLT